MRRYLGAWLALVILAAISFLASGSSLPLAFGIASLKAIVVAVAFMHIARANASVHLAAFTALVLFGLLVGLAAADVATRDPPPLLPPEP